MVFKQFDDFDIDIDPCEPIYIISVVSRLVHIPEWTIRVLDKEGVVSPKRKKGKKRLYCQKDLKRLEYVHYLMSEKGVNIKGIKVILEKEEE